MHNEPEIYKQVRSTRVGIAAGEFLYSDIVPLNVVM